MFDIYQEVTDRIIEQMEHGVIPWQKPWTGSADGAVNWKTQRPYSLLNQMLLGGYGEWATYKQVQEASGKVKKGAKSRIVVFWKPLPKEKKDQDGNVVRDNDGNAVVYMVPFLQYYCVFNIEKDCEGLEPKQKQGECHFDPLDVAEDTLYDYIGRSGVALEFQKQDQAFYSPAFDRIMLPLREQFPDVEEFYSTAFHEAVHSTGHPKRLNRLSLAPSIEEMFGGEKYSKEELVAEIGSAAVMCRIGIETQKSFKNSTAYIQNWLAQLKNDKKLIVSAASRAEKAMRMILGEEEQGEKKGSDAA